MPILPSASRCSSAPLHQVPCLLLLAMGLMAAQGDDPLASDGARLRFHPGGGFKIVQFTDTHWLQVADEDRLIRDRLLLDMGAILDAEHPDLVVLTGDIVTPKSGEHPRQGWLDLTAPMASRRIPWAAVMGNHDDEWNPGVPRRDILAALETMPLSLCQRGPDELGGGGNYILTIAASAGDRPAALLYCLDSRAYSSDRKVFGTYGWFSWEQITWYRQQAHRQAGAAGPLPALAFFHIPLPEYREVATAAIGHAGEGVACAAFNPGMFTAMVEAQDVMGIFVGHDHLNDYAGCLHGICLAFGRKTGASFAGYGKPLPSGARVIALAEGQRAFETWIRTAAGGEESRIRYPDGFVAVGRPAKKE